MTIITETLVPMNCFAFLLHHGRYDPFMNIVSILYAYLVIYNLYFFPTILLCYFTAQCS
jgi:hypothetical protein